MDNNNNISNVVSEANLASASSSSQDSTAAKSTPSSFFTSSISSSDSPYHRIAVLLCPGCKYLEFPGCLMHNGLLANIKGNGYMSCVACELDRKAKGNADVPGGADNVLSMVCATDTAEPWSIACQGCNAVKADTIPWIIADSESVGLSGSMEYEKEDVMPHTAIQCEQCKTTIFPLVAGRLTRRHPTDNNLAIYHPDQPTVPLPVSLFPFKHYVKDCKGALITIPILISKLEGKFCGQALPASPYLPVDSSFVPGFIPPLEWVTGDLHKQHVAREEHRKEKYVLSAIGHRTPVWRDKAFIGVFGDPYVRDTELEGGHIAESIDAMHFILDLLQKSSQLPSSETNSSQRYSQGSSTASWYSTFVDDVPHAALKRVVSVMENSMDTINHAKDALDALVDKDLKDSEKLQFTYRLIKNWRKTIRKMQVGDVIIIPGGWIAPKAGHAIMHIIYRYAQSFSFVTCNTGGGLLYHPSSVAQDGGKMLFRTSIRIDNIRPEVLLDDGFWLVFWRLQTVQSDDHDHHILYEVLLPALAEKPLAEAIVPDDPHAEYRTPQRAGNCYLKCVLECIRYLQRSFGMTKAQTKQMSFNVRRMWMNLCMEDLAAHTRSLQHHPDAGDDKQRRRRKAAKLQAEMRQEAIPEKQQKKKEPSAFAQAAIAEESKQEVADSTIVGSHSTSSESSKEQSDYTKDLPLVNIAAELLNTESTPLHDISDLTMIRLATKQASHAAVKESKAGRLSVTQLQQIWSEIQLIEQEMTRYPLQVHSSWYEQPLLHQIHGDEATFSLDSPTHAKPTPSTQVVTGSSNSSLSHSPFKFPGFDAFPMQLEQSTQEKLIELAGKADPQYLKKPTDFRRASGVITSLDDILTAFAEALQLCIDINAPQVDSLNGYYQVLSLIQDVVTRIPLPTSSHPQAQCWFSRPLTAAEQKGLVRTCWRLGRFYLTSEFSIESPAFVSGMERTVSMWGLITIADWVMRRVPSDGLESGTPVTQVLNGGEGLFPFYMLDTNNGSGMNVRDMIAPMESNSPALAATFGDLVEYWNELETSAKAAGLEVKRILPFSNSAAHQTAMFQENDSTLNFVRDIAKCANYIIERRGYAGKESSEIEAVARWLFSQEEGDYSVGTASYAGLIPQLARDYPEFTHYRDLHFLFKLALVHTHPTCRVVLPGRYTERDASLYWTTQGMPMSNSMVIVYGKAFTKKEILLIKTRSIESFATPTAYLPISAKGSASQQMNSGMFGGLGGLMGGFGGGFGAMFGAGQPAAKSNADWTEEDIIHNTAPALFDGLLSVQSSEHLMCILTAPYLRIPLMLSFFSNKDRVDLLADRRLGKLLSASLFEIGAWASRFHEDDIDDIPFPPPAPSQPNASAAPPAAPGSENSLGGKARVGSPYGLLLNELYSSAGATLNPFLTMLSHAIALDTGYFSVTSSTCRLLLYVSTLTHKMELYVRYALEQIASGAAQSASPLNTQFLQQAHTDLLHIMHGPLLSILLTYKKQAMRVIAEAVWVMSSIALISTSALSIPSYVKQFKPSSAVQSMMTASLRQFDPSSSFPSSSMVELLGSFSFVLTWHSMGIGIGKNLADDENEGEKNKATFGSGASGQDLLSQLAESMQATMNASKLKKQKKEDAKEKEKAAKQPVPEMQLFQSLQRYRSTIIQWVDSCAADSIQLNDVFDQVVQWVHGHKMKDEVLSEEDGAATNVSNQEEAMELSSSTFNPQLVAKKPDLSPAIHSNWRVLHSPQGDLLAGRYVSTSRRLEVDLQTASITFYDHDVFPVHDLIARHEDFLSVFGTEPQHYALIQSKEHMQEYGIFGSSFTLQWWDRNLAAQCVEQPGPAQHASRYNLHSPASVDSALPEGKWKCGGKGCSYINPFSAQRCERCNAYQPMLSAIEKYGIVYRGLPFTRRYGSTYLAPQENWIVEMLEPLLRTLFSDELDTLNYSLWMREEPWTVNDDVVCLFALDAQTFKQIFLYQSSRVLECYNLVEHARVLYRSLIYTSNGRLSLAGLPTDAAPVRMKPWEAMDRFSNGAWEEVQKRSMSFTMKRTRHVTPTMTVHEAFISPPLLLGLLPRVLVDHFHFYFVDDIRYQHSSISSQADRAYNWFTKGDILGYLQKPYRSLVQWNFDLHIKFVPNCTTKNGVNSDSLKSPVAWDAYHAIISRVQRNAAGSQSTIPLSLTPGSSASPSASPSPDLRPREYNHDAASPDASPSSSPVLASTPLASEPFQQVLLNLSTAPPHTFLHRLGSVLTRVDDLSHVLVWARPSSEIESQRDCRFAGLHPTQLHSTTDSSESAYRITQIELPRLKLSFRPRRVTLASGESVWRLFSKDHAGFFISDTRDDALQLLLNSIPNSLLLENDRQELWLLVPNTPLKRPQILSCPFSNELVADRSSAKWMETMDTRFYVYPVHISHTFLMSHTLASTLYLLLLSLLSRDYVSCARYCETCEIDTALSAEEKFVFQLFEETLHDQHPDAHAIRLKLYVCIWLSGDNVGWKSVHGESWSLEDEYSNYCRKLMHVTAACRLSNEEEESIYQQISYEEGQKRDSAPNEQQNRAAVRNAIVQHHAQRRTNVASSATTSTSASPSASASTSQIVLKPPKREGLTTAWWKWESQLPQYLSTEWKPALWSGMVCYERPSELESRDIDLLETIGDVLNDTMTGSMHKKGFLYLLDAVLGGVSVRVDSTSSDSTDCSFSLARLLTQIQFLKETKFGEEVKPQAHYLPFAVLAVFASGFIPIRHNAAFTKPVYSIPSFPPLPQVPYNGMESAMSKGFLLHRQGSPVYQFFIMLSQWATGFVRMCQEWQKQVARAAVPPQPLVMGQAVLEEWSSGQPTNTACNTRTIAPFEFLRDCSLDERTTNGLAGDLLASINVADFLVENTIPTVALTDMPFDVSHHSSSRTYVAQSMLNRLKSELREYAQQIKSERSFQVKGVTQVELQEAVMKLQVNSLQQSIVQLRDLHQLLSNLRSADWKCVQKLQSSISTFSNEVPDVGTPSASLSSLQFVLSRYAGQRFTVHLDYLTALLLSSQPEKDLHELNPHIPQSSIPSLLLLVSTLLLMNNRVGHVDRLLFEIDELRGHLKQLIRKIEDIRRTDPEPTMLVRSLSGGTALIQTNNHSEEMDTERNVTPDEKDKLVQECNHMAQQLAVQSATLATNLLTVRHYMRSTTPSASSGSSLQSYDFDPRFLVFEYIFNILLRKMQIDLVLTFANAGLKKQSLVQQMVMGGGKSTVVGPLLTLMLADGSSLVTMVVPSALLAMSRAVLRARFSSLVPKRIHTLEYDRSTKDDPKHVAKLLYKLNSAKRRQGIVIATAVSVKSLMLKYLELLVALQTANYDPRSLTPFESQQLAAKSLVIDGLSRIMSMWREGILILDEIDLLLHPLKSELNFPAGAKVPLQPAPNRWAYPMHLLDPFFHEHTGHLSVEAFHELPEAQTILNSIQQALEIGLQQHMLQLLPHLIVLNGPYYHQTLKPLFAKWSLMWLKIKGFVAEIPDVILLEYMTSGWSNEEVRRIVGTLLNKHQMVLLNLAYNWLNSYLLHVLSKINRVGYGLLREEEMIGESMSLARRLVAVPFVAKDVPSRSSEFAHSEVLIGLTVLAYRIEGLRSSDLRHLIGVLKNSLAQEMGPESTRPSSIQFNSFIVKARHLAKRTEAQRHAEGKQGGHRQRSRKQVTFHSSATTTAVADIKILPLSQFSLTDPSQLSNLFALVKFLPSMIEYYLNSYLFPTCMNHQVYNLSASGQELGNGSLFSCSLGFSGTPSDLLPVELGKCVYERGTDGKVLNILTDSSVVSYSIKQQWTVHGLLVDVARHQPPFHSLIDTGALITGFSNREVAEFLLENGLPDMEGCVYLDKNDNQMILLRTSKQPIPASQCGVAMHKRFVFFDQIHTTGIDVKFAVNAVAAMTIGKDMTFRDYAQGAFRMRQVGVGQKIHLIIIPEVLKLIQREVKVEGTADDGDSKTADANESPTRSGVLASLPTHIAAWLTINSMRMEQLQFFQLCMQNLHSVWRKKAFSSLLADTNMQSPPEQHARRHLRFDLNASQSADVFWLVECINLFKQPISFDIEDHIPVYKPFFQSLKTMISQHTAFIRDDQQCLAIAHVLNQALEAAAEILPTHAFDKEMINEQEREQEQEKHQEVLKDPRAQRNEEEHIPWKIRKLDQLQGVVPNGEEHEVRSDQVLPTTGLHPFYSLAGFSVEGRPLPLSFPRYLLLSHNFYRQSWALNPKGHRRLKNIYVVLEWCPANPSKDFGVSSDRPVSRSLARSTLTASRQDRFERLFGLLDLNADGVLSGADLQSLRSLLGVVLEQEINQTLVPDTDITKEQFFHIMKSAVKPQVESKISGFISLTAASSSASSSSSSISYDSSFHTSTWLESPSNEDVDRMFAVLPLSEAQILRRAVHSAHPMFRNPTDTQFALWSLDGNLIQSSAHYQPQTYQRKNSETGPRILNPYQRHLSLQVARFFNGELYYSADELLSLLRGMSGIHRAHRQTLVDQLMLCRHRDQKSSKQTTMERLMQMEDESHCYFLQGLRVVMRHRIDAKGLSLLQAFHLFDLNGDGLLLPDEVWSGLNYLGLLSHVTPSDVLDLIRLTDVGEDRAWNFDEFVAAMRLQSDSHHANGINTTTVHGGDVNINEEYKEEQPSTVNSPNQLSLLRMPEPAASSPPPPYAPPQVRTPFQPTAPISAPTVAAASPPVGISHAPSNVAPPIAPVASNSGPRSPISTTPWNCSVCTYLNSAGRSRCEMCDTPNA